MISLRRRFTFWSLGAVALLAAVAGISLYLYVRSALYREFDAGLHTRAQVIGSLLRIEDNGKYGMDFSDESMPEYLPGHHPEYFQILSPDGTTLERSKSLKGKNLVAASIARTATGPWNLILPDGRPGRALVISAMPHADSDDHDRSDWHAPAEKAALAPAMVIVAQDRLQMDRALSALLSALMVAALILAVGSIFAVRFVVWQALSPVNELARRAQEIGPTNLDYRFDIATLPEELRLICQRLNELLKRLDQAFRRERRLNADIAHELRTPIAELRSLTEVACKWPTDADQSSIYFHDAHAIALKMGSLVDTLLNLARGKTGASQDEKVALASIIESSLSSQRETIASRQLRASIELPASCSIVTHRLLFMRMIDNVISNAVDHASHGGQIECRAEHHENECWLTIGNSNDSLSAGDVPQMFEPFWRKDAARSDSKHTGLGLALVAEYAVQLGYIVSAHLRIPTWFEIILKIPVSAINEPEVKHLADGIKSDAAPSVDGDIVALKL
jgi:signal transduction histidine kinase